MSPFFCFANPPFRSTFGSAKRETYSVRHLSDFSIPPPQQTENFRTRTAGKRKPQTNPRRTQLSTAKPEKTEPRAPRTSSGGNFAGSVFYLVFRLMFVDPEQPAGEFPATPFAARARPFPQCGGGMPTPSQQIRRRDRVRIKPAEPTESENPPRSDSEHENLEYPRRPRKPSRNFRLAKNVADWYCLRPPIKTPAAFLSNKKRLNRLRKKLDLPQTPFKTDSINHFTINETKTDYDTDKSKNRHTVRYNFTRRSNVAPRPIRGQNPHRPQL